MSSILITGASRGIGRGIALELALAGNTVYITGRSEKTLGQVNTDFKNLSSKTSGKIIPLVCDHAIDSEVDNLFTKIPKLDVLINNAYAAVSYLGENADTPFHELGIEAWDIVNNVGLRNHYRCCHHAANKMIETGSNKETSPGLIVNISSMGGGARFFNAAYGIGKEAKDRMMSEFAYDLRKCNIYCVSLWPGGVKTESVMAMLKRTPTNERERKGLARLKALFENGESTRFSGRCLAKIIEQRTRGHEGKQYLKAINGGVVMTSDVGKKFGLTDVDNKVIPSMLSVKMALTITGYKGVAAFIPGWVKIPKFVFVLGYFGKRFR